MVNSLPKGIRLNNPGNIEHGQPWSGLAAPQYQTDERFCYFVAPEWGIRAIHKILQTYQTKYGLTSIQQMLNKWAPSIENNTEAYIKDVDSRVAGSSTDSINLFDSGIAFSLVTAIIAHENANYKYEESIVWQGLMLAGVPTP